MLQFITHQNDKFTYYTGASAVLRGGCKWVQLRFKEVELHQFISCAEMIKNECKTFGATFIIDDYVEYAKKIVSDGVHLGKNDMSIKEARKLLGNNFIIGATANTFEDVENAYSQGANYIGCGPFRFTTTKKNLSPVLGLEGYREIIENMKKNKIDIPIIAIGGILKEDVKQIMQLGVSGIAISGAILNAQDPESETKEFLKLLE